MEVRLFGALEAVAAGVPVPVRGAKQRALLALLALQRGQPVSSDRLIDVPWGDGQAANPANALQAQTAQRPRPLGPAAILTTEAGYALAAGPGEVDVVRFEQLVAMGQRLGGGGGAGAGGGGRGGGPPPGRGARRGRRRPLRAAGRDGTAAGRRRRDGAGVGGAGRGPRPAARRAAGRVHLCR